jgi:hypothetical protein
VGIDAFSKFLESVKFGEFFHGIDDSVTLYGRSAGHWAVVLPIAKMISSYYTHGGPAAVLRALGLTVRQALQPGGTLLTSRIAQRDTGSTTYSTSEGDQLLDEVDEEMERAQ